MVAVAETQADISQLMIKTTGLVVQHMPLYVIIDMMYSTTDISQPFSAPPDLDLSSLVNRRVKKLDLHHASMPGPRQIASIRQMEWLIHVEFPESYHASLFMTQLLQPGHKLQRVKYMTMDGVVIGGALMDRLVGLPELTHFNSTDIDPTCWGRLGELSRLQYIHCKTRVCNDDQLQQLGTTLSTLCHLRHLQINVKDDNDNLVGWHALEFNVPTLQDLVLSGVPVWTLTFLQYSPQLLRIEIELCGREDTVLFIQSLLDVLPMLPELRILRISGLRGVNLEQRNQLSLLLVSRRELRVDLRDD